MDIIKYTKEFLYLFSGITALFACAAGFILLALAPFGLSIYINDVLGYHSIFGITAVIMTYCAYWVAARHFKLIEGLK